MALTYSTWILRVLQNVFQIFPIQPCHYFSRKFQGLLFCLLLVPTDPKIVFRLQTPMYRYIMTFNKLIRFSFLLWVKWDLLGKLGASILSWWFKKSLWPNLTKSKTQSPMWRCVMTFSKFIGFTLRLWIKLGLLYENWS